MERMTPPTSSPDPLGGTPRTSTPVSTRKRRSPSKGISDYPQRQSLPALNDLHHGSQEIDPGQSHDATEDSRASPSFDGVGFSSSIVDHRSSQQSPEWTIASLNNARSASPAKKDTTKDSLGFTLSSPQEVFPALSFPSNSLENVRGGPSTTRIDARATLFPSATKQKLSKDPSDHSHLLIRPPDRPRTSRIQDVNPVKSARKLVLPTTTKQTPLPSLSSPPGQHNHSGLPPTRTQSYTENAHTDQQEEDSIEMLRNLGPIRHRDDSHSRASLFKLPGSDTLFGCESDEIEEVEPDVMGFMEDAGGFDGLVGSTGLTKRVREGGNTPIPRNGHNDHGQEFPSISPSLLSNPARPHSPDFLPQATPALSRILKPEPADPRQPSIQPDEQDWSIDHRTLPSERQLKRRPSIVYRPARRRSLSIGSRVEERNDDYEESSSNLELPSTVDDGVSDGIVAPRTEKTLQLTNKPAPRPQRHTQGPQREKPRPAKGKKRSVFEPTSSEHVAINARKEQLRAIDAYELEVDYVVWDE